MPSYAATTVATVVRLRPHPFRLTLPPDEASTAAAILPLLDAIIADPNAANHHLLAAASSGHPEYALRYVRASGRGQCLV